jgi:hypothetical protein
MRARTLNGIFKNLSAKLGNDPRRRCDDTLTRYVATLGDAHLSKEQATQLIREAADLGGTCDCKVLLNASGRMIERRRATTGG